MSLTVQLVALSGPLKGESFPIGDTPIVLGRDRSCDIRLYSPPASRRHCVIKQSGDALRLEELNARNPVLVNGRPVREANLHVADTVAIGDDVYLVSNTRSATPVAMSASPERETLSLGDLLSARWDERPRSRRSSRPTTAEQLVFLFDTIQELSTCASRANALAVLTERLQECFRPDAVWFVRRPQGRTRLRFQRLDSENTFKGNLPSSKVVRAVLSGGHGTSTQHGAPNDDGGPWFSSLVAPFIVTGVSLGAVVLQRAPDRPAFEAEDSAFLDVIARVSAPSMHMAETIGQLEQENTRLRRRVGEASELVGKSSAMREFRDQLEKAAQTDLSVLLLGETGTGKEIAARVLHVRSRRSGGPFVIVNCAAIPGELFESQVFGYREGAFTGARETFDGLFAQADGGTLFLDEVADLSPPNQARILRAVELGAFRPLGASAEVSVDVRIVAATNRNVKLLKREGGFREDLYHRLSGFELTLPPLRTRKEDIPLLAMHFFDMAKDSASHPIEGISREALQLLAEKPWPGNVRELRNTILRAIGTATDLLIRPDDLLHDGPPAFSAPEDESLDAWEKQHIAHVLACHSGNVRKAANALGIGRSTLYKKLAAHGLSY